MALSLGAILLLLPLLILLSLLILVTDPGPVLFTQRRVGKDKRLFTILKFRTMKTSTPDLPTHLLKDPERYITPVGSFLRRTSLDELPQLFNILVGQMSIVGPRPALWSQDDLIALRDQNGANDLRPGLTGLAQINGRDELPLEKKAFLDGEYASRLKAGKGFSTDAKCFFATFRKVLFAEGIKEGAP